MNCFVHVMNVPEYATKYTFIVTRLIDGCLWFWGAYDTPERAKEAVESFDEGNGLIVINKEGEEE